MNFYTHAAQGRIRGCISKSFIQIPIFVSRSRRSSGQRNGTGAPWCPMCGAAGAANPLEADSITGVFTQNLKNAAEMFMLNSRVLSRGFSALPRVYVEHVVATHKL